jgi:mannosyltransferase
MKVAPRNADYLWLAVALVAGALVRFWHVTGQSPFLDEAFSLKIGAEPIGQLLHDTAYRDVQPPLFYLFTHAVLGIVHWPAWDFRLLTAPFGLITIVATWAIGRKTAGSQCAAFAAIFVALAPGVVLWDRLFRMYSIWMAVTAVSWWLLATADDTKPKIANWRWPAYIAIAAVMPYLQYLGALTLVSQAAYAFSKPAARWPVFVGCGAAVLAFVPWLWAFRLQFAAGATAEPTPPWWDPAVELFALGAPVAWTGASPFLAGVAIVLIAAIVTGAVVLRRSLVVYWLGGIAFQMAIGAVVHKDLMLARYLFAYVPAMALAVGATIQAGLSSKARVAATAFGAALATLFAVCTQNIVLDPLYQFTDWFQVNGTVLAQERAGDAFVFVQAFPVVIVGSYSAFRGRPVTGPNVPEDVPATIAWIRGKATRRIWYIENQPWYADPGGLVHRAIVAHRPLIGRWAEAKAYAANAVSIELFGPEGR